MKNKIALLSFFLSLISYAHSAATITSVVVASANVVNITFSEAVDDKVALVASNYKISGTGIGTFTKNPNSVVFDSGTTYKLTWINREMFNGGNITITVGFLGLSSTHTLGGIGTSPTVSSVKVSGSRSVDVTFSEAMKDGILTAANYALSGTGKGSLSTNPSSVSRLHGNTYRLAWSSGDMLNGGNITITLTNAKDLASHVISSNGTHSSGATGSSPTILTLAVPSTNSLDVTFSETMAVGGGVLTASNYTLTGIGVGTFSTNPNSVALVAGDTYRLTWNSGEMLTSGSLTVTAANATDSAGNIVSSSKTLTTGGLGVAPIINSVAVQTYNTVNVTFSEAMGTGVLTATNYTVSGTGKNTLTANPASVTSVGGNSYRLTWTSGIMIDGGNITIAAKNAMDSIGNITTSSATHTGGSRGYDPLYAYQWHLKNTGQLSGTIGEDINVEPVWASCSGNTCRGEGVRIAVVDDGMEIAHEDLKANIVANKSYNYLNGTTNPTNLATDLESGHGTMVSGIIAARDNNNLGVKGVAPRAGLVGYNLLKNLIASNEANAMTRDVANISISSNSWGAPDGYGDLQPASSTWKTAITTGLTSGRGGLGTIYVWAAGNGNQGLGGLDLSNYDGQANNRGVIAVGAYANNGIKSSYSEMGANLWVSAPGGEFCDTAAITTVDRTGAVGKNRSGVTDYSNRNYTKCMNGTSSATPMVSGVVALMLQANPSLGWRDVRLILAQTARKINPLNVNWATNSAGFDFNLLYGFGAIDAEAAVNAALAYGANLPNELTYTTATSSPYVSIPDNNATGVTRSIAVSGSGISAIEWLEVTFTAANHTYSGDLQVLLTSPAGTVSILSLKHECQNANGCTAYDAWVFGVATNLGEAANGTWTLKVQDLAAGDTGTFQSWKLKFYGI